MLDLLRNPNKAAGVRAHFAEKRAAENSSFLHEKKIEQAARRLRMDSSLFGTTATLIRSQGTRAEPALLLALSDPDFLASRAASDHALDNSPAVTALRLLGEVGTQRCLPVLFRMMELRDEDLSDTALAAIIRIAGPGDFPRVARIVQGIDPADRGSVLAAVRNRFYGRAATEEEKKFFWPLILGDADESGRLTFGAVEALQQIDLRRLSAMLSKDLHSADEQVVLAAAWNLSYFDGPVEVPRLDALMDRIDEAVLRASILKSSASQTRDRDVWESLWRSEVIREPVGDSLWESSRVSALLDAIAAFLGHASIYEVLGDDQPNDELAQPVLDLKLIMNATGEISNGGLLQFFFNSTGVTWRSVAEAIERNRLGVAAGLIWQAAGTIGLAADDTDRPAIERRLAALNRGQEKRLEELTKEFFGISNGLTLAIALHIADHREWFVPPRENLHGSGPECMA